ncbi:afadin [Elysia marginata]|uniref:Afadin n=1 Tax=Elysia marginata TaxID=1093978 RepID=A0AAV4HLC2_9GAST|nr:afadin [Elysia marginata]
MNKGMPPNRGFNDEGPPPYDGRDQKPLNGFGDHDRGRLNEPYSRRDMGDSRSKSTSNLHVETNLDRGDMQHHHSNQSQLRPAQSVGVLHPASPGYGQYSPGGRRMDMRQNDYENQPRYPNSGDRNSYEGSTGSGGGGGNRPGYNFVDPRQNLPGEGKPQPSGPQQQQLIPRQTSERSSVSSRASSGSNRPQSAYFDPQSMNRSGGGDGPQESPWSRPRSEDVGSKLKEWQDKYEEPWRQGKQYNDDRLGGGNNSPPYSNIGAHNRDIPPQPQHNPPPKPSAHERLFSNSNMHHPQHQQQQHQQYPSQGGMPQKMPMAPPQHRQPNFYENTAPLTQAPAPAFHQLPQVRFPTDSENRPRPAPKPAVIPATRRGQPRVQHSEMPMVRVDGRGSQPQFYGDNPGSPMTHTVQQPGFNNAGPSQTNIGQQHPSQIQDYGNRGQDLRYDPRNGPPPQQHPQQMHHQQPEFRGVPPQDGRDVPDLRNAPDPRNNNMTSPSANGPNYRAQQHGGVYQQQQPELRNSYSQQQQQGYYPDQQQYGYPANDLPPPPAHTELPPMPLHQEEELPPLPPPPSTEALLADEQAKLMQQINATNQFLATETGSRPKRYSPNTQQQQQQQQQQPYQQPPHQPQHQQQHRFQPPPQQQQQHQQSLQSSNPNQPRRVLPPGINTHDSTPMGYQVAPEVYQSRINNDPSSQHNYQNINFAADARAASGPTSQAPPVPQPPSEYESYDNAALRAQGFAMKPAVPANKPKPRDRTDANNRSAWDRDARERAEEQEQEDLFRAREQEIADLESRPYLNPGEQERLRKLKMEHEFQRRVREIAEKGDYEYEDDDELAERLFTRERLIATLKEDLEKSKAKHRDLEIAQQRADAAREQERLQMLERRLEMYEKDREEQRQRMQRKQDKRTKEHQEQLRQQRESREKQRQNFEEQKRQLLKEEEKLSQRREEEMSKRRQFERERRQELQEKRDAEEKRARAEIRAEEEEYRQQQMAMERQQRADQDRTIRVSDERRRINSMNNNSGQISPPGYSQYANVGGQNLDSQDLGGPPPPPPPQRNSSYEMFSQHQQRGSFRGGSGSSSEFPPPPPPIQNNGMGQQLPPSAMKSTGEPPAPAKKSVSFNTQMNTYKDRTPSHSISSYQSPHGSQSSDPGLLPPPLHSLGSPETDVFDQGFPPPPSPPQAIGNNNNGPSTPTTPPQSYNTSTGTPNVIGAQEIYRDPRSKIEAKLASGRGSAATDRMSFREKMKYFAQEAGEDTIKYKPKASKTLRSIESQLNGQ